MSIVTFERKTKQTQLVWSMSSGDVHPHSETTEQNRPIDKTTHMTVTNKKQVATFSTNNNTIQEIFQNKSLVLKNKGILSTEMLAGF